MNVSPARLAAFNILLRIETERAFSSILLPLYESKLQPVDRGLCHELVLGALRKQLFLDRVIDEYSKGKRLDVAVRIALRLGVYQILFLDKIPQYSAVNESVQLVRRAKKSSATGFVNAVLRRVTRKIPDLGFYDQIDRLCIETSHPRWLMEKWIDEFGADDAAKIAFANNERGHQAFRLLGSVELKAFRAQPSEFVEGCYLTDQISNELMAAAQKHDVYFQDEGSQMIACSIAIPDKGRFLDLCAAPGGKTGLVSRRNSAKLDLTVAGDLHWQRVLALKENCAAQRAANVNVVQYDAEKDIPFAAESFNAVLVDAPCSGTGTIRHNPELRYFVDPADIAELSEKQLRILRNASKLVAGGGSLVYSTCSLEVEENESVCDRFLSETSGFRQVRPTVHERFVTDKGSARTFPHRDGMDGFFIAAFRRD